MKTQTDSLQDLMYKNMEILYMTPFSCIDNDDFISMTAFACPTCNCVYVDDPNPRCTYYRCDNQERKYSEDV